MPKENLLKVDKLVEDNQWVPRDLMLSAGTDLIEIIYGNFEKCQFERVWQDYMRWCLANMDKCSFEAMNNNLSENMMPFIASGFDIFETINNTNEDDDSNLERLYQNIGSMVASITGFKGHWDPSKPLDELTFPAFQYYYDSYFFTPEQKLAEQKKNEYFKNWLTGLVDQANKK